MQFFHKKTCNEKEKSHPVNSGVWGQSFFAKFLIRCMAVKNFVGYGLKHLIITKIIVMCFLLQHTVVGAVLAAVCRFLRLHHSACTTPPLISPTAVGGNQGTGAHRPKPFVASLTSQVPDIAF